jgi:hypothetical protein
MAIITFKQLVELKDRAMAHFIVNVCDFFESLVTLECFEYNRKLFIFHTVVIEDNLFKVKILCVFQR